MPQAIETLALTCKPVFKPESAVRNIQSAICWKTAGTEKTAEEVTMRVELQPCDRIVTMRYQELRLLHTRQKHISRTPDAGKGRNQCEKGDHADTSALPDLAANN